MKVRKKYCTTIAVMLNTLLLLMQHTKIVKKADDEFKLLYHIFNWFHLICCKISFCHTKTFRQIALASVLSEKVNILLFLRPQSTLKHLSFFYRCCWNSYLVNTYVLATLFFSCSLTTFWMALFIALLF